MTKCTYLTMEQIDILLKCYYLKGCPQVARTEGLSIGKVSYTKEKALRLIRWAYRKSYKKSLPFCGEIILQDMAECCGVETEELSNTFDQIITQGLSSESKKYWERIKKKGDVPTAAELLDFIYDKYELEIEVELFSKIL